VVDAAMLDAAPRLKVVGRHGVGYDHIDVPAATERGVLVLTTPGAIPRASASTPSA
jgi:phosphoglycerate dehydrogenase-like enzyme